MVAQPSTFDLRKRTSRDDRSIVQGATFQIELVFDDSYAADWTGFAARGQIRSDVADETGSDVLAEITVAIVDPAARTLSLYMSAETTQAITEQSGRYDLEIYN